MAPSDKRLTQAQLKKFLNYDSEMGVFTRIYGWRPQAARYVGKTTGYLSWNRYWIIEVERQKYRAHRLAWLYMTGEWPPADIDHINGERSDNRWENLRLATRSQNIANARLAFDNRTGVKGIHFDSVRNKWLAQITVNGVHRFLGRYDEKEAAAEAYRTAALESFGKFARTP